MNHPARHYVNASRFAFVDAEEVRAVMHCLSIAGLLCITPRLCHGRLAVFSLSP
jgi:hypothetical protein